MGGHKGYTECNYFRIEERINRIEEKLSARIDNLDQKFSRYFLWIGFQITILVSIIATMLR